MSLLQMLFYQFQVALVNFVITASRFEAESLHVPRSMRFFTTGAGPNKLYAEAAFLFVALLHAFFTLPLMDLVHGYVYADYTPWSWGRALLRCGKRYLLLSVTFWTIIVVVR
jgi:hypothetical protein